MTWKSGFGSTDRRPAQDLGPQKSRPSRLALPCEVNLWSDHRKIVAAANTVASVTNPAPCNCAAGNFSVRTSADTTAMSPSSNVVILGPASKLAFTTQPVDAIGGTAFPTQPVVTIQDSAGNTVAGNSSSVTLAITSGTGTSGATLTCTANPKAAAGGVASFAGCRIDKAGTGYTLTATDGALTSVASAAFTVSASTPTKVVFSQQPPATGTAGSALTSFRAAVQDANGNTVTTGTGATDALTLSIASGPVGGTFNSAATTYTNVVAVGGVATFSGVVLNTAGSYTFTATDTSRALSTATSTPATAISPATASRLAFAQNPAESLAGAALTPTVTVQVQDQFGNSVPASGVTVALSSSAGPLDAGSTATTGGTGLASFGTAQINTAAAGLTLTATATGLSAATSTAFDVVVQVSNGAALTDAAADAGSGMKSVSYFYCAGSSWRLHERNPDRHRDQRGEQLPVQLVEPAGERGVSTGRGGHRQRDERQPAECADPGPDQ